MTVTVGEVGTADSGGAVGGGVVAVVAAEDEDMV